MKLQTYFKKIGDSLEKTPYKERYLKELQDHAEDLIEAEANGDEEGGSKLAQERFGSPEFV